MKILEITVRFQVATKAEEAQLMEFIGVKGRSEDIQVDKGVKEAGEVAYTPSSDRTKAAADALSKCKRVGVLRLEVLETWANAFPHVDLASEIMKCEAWAESKGVTRTARGWTKALNSWLSKAQDSVKGSQLTQVAFKPVAPAPVAIEEETRMWIEAAS
jgi:hypothetical protein